MNDASSLNTRALWWSILGSLAMAAFVFIPAGTLNYWQGWLFLAVFAAASGATTVYLAVHDPALLERRMTGKEKEGNQRIIQGFLFVAFIGLLVVSALDHRLGRSVVPWPVSILGDVLIVVSFFLIFLVFRENSFGGSTIRIAEDHKVISTGPYALVRHPMYAAALPMLIGIPLALGSWWGLLVVAVFVPALVWRIIDEERFLLQNLPGYAEYARRVRYHLIPYVW
jgi:protein-S-isoprenylcysteine O-methyltransferase Ste14